MANFVLLYSGGSMPETQAEQAAVMKAWEAWFGGLGSALEGRLMLTPIGRSLAVVLFRQCSCVALFLSFANSNSCTLHAPEPMKTIIPSFFSGELKPDS